MGPPLAANCSPPRVCASVAVHCHPACYGQGGIRTHGTLAGTPVFETGRFNRSRTCPTPRRIGWDSNPRNGYPFTRSPGACLQPLGHLSELLDAQTRSAQIDAQTRSKYQDRAGFATGGAPAKPRPWDRVYFESDNATHEGEEQLMNTLPTKKPGDPDVNTIPTWRELAERFRDLVKDFLKEGKELERELEPKLLPALKRFKLEIEKLISKLEQRAK